MIRSSNQDLGEYDLIQQPDHIAKVWSVIDASLPQYWDCFVESAVPPDPAVQLNTKFNTTRKKVPGEVGRVLAHLFEKAVHDYEKEAKKYRRFFDLGAFDEYRDDPNAFKHALSRDVPIIANTLSSRRTELKEWQKSFRMAYPKDLLAVFESILDFIGEWREAHPIDHYIRQASELEPSGFGLDPLDDDETMFIANVIGMGIKSIVLFHLDPERLPPRGRYGLYGLYFLSKMQDFGLASGSSEFLMVNDINPTPDGSIIMDHNYWYPYGLFSLYSLRVYNWIEARSQEVGVTLDPDYVLSTPSDFSMPSAPSIKLISEPCAPTSALSSQGESSRLVTRGCARQMVPGGIVPGSSA